MPDVLATLVVVAIVAFVVARLTRKQRNATPPANCEQKSTVKRVTPSRTLKLLTDKLDELEARRLVPDRAKIEGARNRARETLNAVLKVKLLYEYERLDCMVANAYLEESDATRARCDPPEIHIAVPLAADVVRVAELASLPIDLWRDPPPRRRRRRRRKAFWAGHASPSLPTVDRWLRRAVLETTAWLNVACDAAERYAWPAAARADYARLAGRAVRLARRFVRVDARFDARADRTTVTVDFATAADFAAPDDPAEPDEPDDFAANTDAHPDVVAADGQRALIRDRRRQNIWSSWSRAFAMCCS